jgi:hypothetical protein
VYIVKARLGEAYTRLEPYPLFPVDEYFGSNRPAHIRPFQPSAPR